MQQHDNCTKSVYKNPKVGRSLYFGITVLQERRRAWDRTEGRMGGKEEGRCGICGVQVDRGEKVSLNRYVKEIVSLTRKSFHEGQWLLKAACH